MPVAARRFQNVMDKTKAEKEKERRPHPRKKGLEILSTLRCGAEVLDAAKFIRKKESIDGSSGEDQEEHSI